MPARTEWDIRIPLVFRELDEATGAELQGIGTPDPRVMVQRFNVCCF
jgi:hypothetical protein